MGGSPENSIWLEIFESGLSYNPLSMKVVYVVSYSWYC